MARKLFILGVVVLAVALVGSTALAGKGGIASYQYPLIPEDGVEAWGMVTLVGQGGDCDGEPACPYAYMLVMTVKDLDPEVEYYLGFGPNRVETPYYPNNGGNLTIKYEFCCTDLFFPDLRGINLRTGSHPTTIILATGSLGEEFYCPECNGD